MNNYTNVNKKQIVPTQHIKTQKRENDYIIWTLKKTGLEQLI